MNRPLTLLPGDRSSRTTHDIPKRDVRVISLGSTEDITFDLKLCAHIQYIIG